MFGECIAIKERNFYDLMFACAPSQSKPGGWEKSRKPGKKKENGSSGKGLCSLLSQPLQNILIGQ